MQVKERKVITPNRLSFRSHKVLICSQFNSVRDDNSTVQPIATGFFYKYNDELYFITNWHVVSGKHPDTNNLINGFIPTELKICIRSYEHKIPSFHTLDYELYDDQKADWYIHPAHGKRIDVVALKITNNWSEHKPTIEIKPINELPFDQIKATVADDVFVLGYPRGLDSGLYFPLWKKGSIASEPDLDYKGLPRIVIDCATREGMSGAPVIVRRFGLDGLQEIKADSIIGTIEDFFGIYSGRIDVTDELSAHLGIVWKKSVIEEIIKGNQKDTLTI